MRRYGQNRVELAWQTESDMAKYSHIHMCVVIEIFGRTVGGFSIFAYIWQAGRQAGRQDGKSSSGRTFNANVQFQTLQNLLCMSTLIWGNPMQGVFGFDIDIAAINQTMQQSNQTNRRDNLALKKDNRASGRALGTAHRLQNHWRVSPNVLVKWRVNLLPKKKVALGGKMKKKWK